MKVIALYLPQFHEVEENNIWWGKGFTEWTTVKNAKAFFENHLQPKIPFNNNYYDLLEYETMEWQANLMREYGIDGVCIYHYWFKDGRQILEKPAENLLRWKNIDMPFCFSWANEAWARTWSKLANKNIWTSEFEKEDKKIGSGILLDQKYGDKKEWEEHFNYLLPFFRDDRYIKVDGKPVFMFHKLCDIYCFENMITYWQELARENSLPGIYVIGNSLRDAQKKYVDKVFLCEPGYSLYKCKSTHSTVKKINYDEVWEKILLEDFSKGTVGGFVSYDDTPRRGSNGVVIEDASVEKFEIFFSDLLKRNSDAGNEMVFVNAWNEWGEGMYLEPDVENNYGYLNAIKRARASVILNESKVENRSRREERYIAEDIMLAVRKNFDKEKHFRILLDKWVDMHENGITIKECIKRYSHLSIAVYGYGILGKHLIKELLNAGINVEYIVDRRELEDIKIPIYKHDENWPRADLMIVTATYEYGDIYKLIREKDKMIQIVSLEHLIMEMN